MINAAAVEAIKQLITLLLIIALLFSPANVLAGVNTVSEIDKENRNCTNDHSNGSNVQDNSGSTDNISAGGNSGSSDHNTSGQTNSNVESFSTTTPKASETGSPGFLEPNQSDGSISKNDVNGDSALSDSEDLIYASAADNDPPQYYSEPNNTDTVSKSGEDINSQSCCSSSGHSVNASAEETGSKEDADPAPDPEQAKETSSLIDKTSSTVNNEIQALNDNDATSDTSPISADDDFISGGNSYIAIVIPEDGKMIKQGEPTALTVTFTELGDTLLGSAQLFIPKSLTVDTEVDIEISGDWDYRWEDPVDNSAFSKVLSLWAILEGNYLGKDNSISATFTATASSDQTHHFDTKAWQEAALDGEGKGTGVSSDPSKVNNYLGYNPDTGQYELGYSQPKINVWVDSAGDGYRTTGVGDGTTDLSVDDPRGLSAGDLFVGLDNVRNNLNWHYVQVEDIELADYLSPDGAGYNAGAGWEPIGSDSNRFLGGYHGGGYIIEGLKIERGATDYIGLFGSIGEGSLISSVILQNVNVTGKNIVGSLVGENRNGVILNSSAQGTVTATGSNVGGLVGRNNRVNRDDTNYGVINNCFTLVTVTGVNNVGGLVGNNMRNAEIKNSSAGKTISESGLQVTGNSSVGGLAGRNDGAIANSFSTMKVISTGSGDVRLGGLIGHNNLGSVVNSYASGEVFTANGDRVGGLIGMNSSSRNVENCYALGSVSGNSIIGGLIGLDNGNGSIVNNYAVGQISGNQHLGGLVGHQSTGNIINSYYQNNASSNNAFGEPKSQEELFARNTYNGWSIDHIDNIDSAEHTWYIDDGNAYPILWWQYERECDNGDNGGDEDDGSLPPDDDQDSPNGDGPKEDPGDNKNNQPPSPGLYNNYSPGNNSFGLFRLPPPTGAANNVDEAFINQYLLVLIIGEPGNTPESLINTDFINEGGWEDYYSALSAYENLIELFETSKHKLSSQEYATVKIDMAIAYAAIKIVEARLLDLEIAYEEALQAYETALLAIEEYGSSLKEDQINLAVEILTIIESFLSEHSH